MGTAVVQPMSTKRSGPDDEPDGPGRGGKPLESSPAKPEAPASSPQAVHDKIESGKARLKEGHGAGAKSSEGVLEKAVESMDSQQLKDFASRYPGMEHLNKAIQGNKGYADQVKAARQDVQDFQDLSQDSKSSKATKEAFRPSAVDGENLMGAYKDFIKSHPEDFPHASKSINGTDEKFLGDLAGDYQRLSDDRRSRCRILWRHRLARRNGRVPGQGQERRRTVFRRRFGSESGGIHQSDRQSAHPGPGADQGGPPRFRL